MTAIGRVALAAAVLAALWTVRAGKDLSWDLLHYHFYAAYALVGNRLEQDFFAASAQGYLNAVGYVPFYWLSANWHSVTASVVMALVHSANIVLLYALALRLFAHHEPRDRALLALLAAALGAASAVFWAMVGTSFLDPLLTVPMLGGLLLLTDERTPRRLLYAAAAGLLFGAAAALKYSNALFAIAAAVPAAMQPAATAAQRMRALLAYAVGVVAGLALFGGYAFVQLYLDFGNPVFPLLNGWFRSPDFPPMNFAAERFAPRSLAEALLFPLRIVTPNSMTYAEIGAPDLRFLALGVLLAAWIAVALWQRRPAAAAPRAPLASVDRRVLAFFALAYAGWLATSANGRYGVLLLLLVGLLVARLADRVLPLPATRGALLILLLAQVVACLMISPARWFMTDRWSTRWFPYDAPERAVREPALYVTVETQAMTVIVPFVHPASSFVNLRGQHSVDQGAPRLQALIARHEGRIRTIGRALRLQRDGQPRPDIVELYDSTLLRYGLRVDPHDCFRIGWRPERSDTVSEFANLLVTESAGVRESNVALVSCGLQPGSWSAAELEAERRISTLFDRMEQSCAGLFRGQTALTERLGKEWSRTYAGLEARLETRGDALVLAPFFQLQHHYLGSISEWASGVPAPLREACAKGLPR